MAHKPLGPVLRDNIGALAFAYTKAKGIQMSTLSRYIRGDMYFLEDYLAANVSVTVKKYDEIIAWFDDRWPQGVAKPKIKSF